MAPPDHLPVLDPDLAVTQPLRPMIAASVLSLLLFAMSSAIIYIDVRASPPAAVRPLLVYTAGLLAFWVAATATMALRRPAAVERVRFWGNIARVIIYASHLACFGLIWGVMPYVDTATQLLIAIPLIGCIPSQIICSPENAFANRSGILTVLGSLALLLATRNAESARMASLYVVGFGGVMFVLSNAVNRTVKETVAARLASDRTARDLDRLLGEVAAERDAKTKFIAAASHDLGQPLQAAALFFDQSLRTTDEFARAKAVDGVRRALASADQLLSHMLGHLRLESDAVEPHRSRVAVRALLVRVAAQCAPAAQAAGLEIRIAGADVMLLLDPSLTERAVGNLINNAIQHSRGRRLLLGVRRHGDCAFRLWAIDDGIGVGRTDARHIFDDYYQGQPATGSVRVGFGLGLSSVRRLAAIMGGTAGLDCRWRRGAAFYLEFPAASAVDAIAAHRELAA